MKKMMMALAALCVAGAASAVTWKWQDATIPGELKLSSDKTGGTDVVTKRQDLDLSSQIGDATSWAIKCTLTIGADYQAPANWGVLVGLGGTSNDNGDARFCINNNTGAIQLSMPANSGLTAPSENNFGALAADASYTFMIECTQQEGGVEVTFTLGDKSYYAGVIPTDNQAGLDPHVLSWGAQRTGGNNALSASTSWEISDIKYATVPEPTALALLALGVAGLALRRKAA